MPSSLPLSANTMAVTDSPSASQPSDQMTLSRNVASRPRAKKRKSSASSTSSTTTSPPSSAGSI